MPHGMCHRNGFTRSSAYKLGLKSPILAEKAQNIVIFCAKFDFKFIFHIFRMPLVDLWGTLSMKMGSLMTSESKIDLKQHLLAKNASNLGFLEPNFSFRI